MHLRVAPVAQIFLQTCTAYKRSIQFQVWYLTCRIARPVPEPASQSEAVPAFGCRACYNVCEILHTTIRTGTKVLSALRLEARSFGNLEVEGCNRSLEFLSVRWEGSSRADNSGPRGLDCVHALRQWRWQ
ncbi:hypothetical protein M011DRAFT_172275 [Sporormia fimetaria CBS 119925]|uniref:Uncharacterized protein n=1 Tax=Sporormia fimetaria CBS 119925 TaxID=1340428 RepID=A0A6A6V1R3_9PLEO|nr:hypothetical protein M011DRAFT_172275 [Sporormia fimetaria CBS 119925]